MLPRRRKVTPQTLTGEGDIVVIAGRVIPEAIGLSGGRSWATSLATSDHARTWRRSPGDSLARDK
jgi:hypothetical protein